MCKKLKRTAKSRNHKKATKRHSFIIENYFFKKTLEKGEEIKDVIHTHPIIYHLQLSKIKMTYVIFPAIMWYLFPIIMPICVGLIALGIFKLIMLVWSWYHQTWLITNKGVISIYAKSFWNVNATRIDHEMIGGVSYEIKGAAASMLKYGEITLEKMGNGTEAVSLKNAKDPLNGELKILKWKKKHLNSQSTQTQDSFIEMLHEMTQVYEKVKA